MRRGRLYLEAGADCIYPFGFYDVETTAALVKGINGPINVIGWRNKASLSRLAELGVRRVTFATGLFRDSMTALKETAEAIRAQAPGAADGSP